MADGIAAIILAGGQSRRMGVDKATLRWSGRRAIDLVVARARQAGCEPIVVAGRDYGYPYLPDLAPLSGPAPAILGAIDRLPGPSRFLILAVDAPLVDVDDLRRLLAAPPPGAHFVGQPLPLHISRTAAAKAHGARSVHAIAERAGLVGLAAPAAALPYIRGANTPQELARLRPG